MSILFYDHLIDKKPIHHHINSINASEEKKAKFRQLADNILHDGILEFILQELHPHRHQTFLYQLERAPYDPELINYLKEHIDHKIEEEIQKQANRILKLIEKDLS